MKDLSLTRRKFIKKVATGGLSLAIGGTAYSCASKPLLNYPEEQPDIVKKISGYSNNPPNIIIINADDLGYGDLGCYGSSAIKTPFLDSLAKQGVRFTDFNTSDSVCTPSRAGLLTGRYPKRMKLDVPLMPEGSSVKKKLLMNIGYLAGSLGIMDLATEKGAYGLHQQEITLPEALKVRDYQTCMVGKWHLGDYSSSPEHNPINHGFDSYFGVPHSNDMTPFPLYRNEKELEAHITDQSKLTGLYTEEAVKFIESSQNKPFFLYLAHTFPHRPLYASKDFENNSEGGIFGDSVEEIDWSVGQILNVLKKYNLEDNTIIMFTSDNGPWYQGSPGAFRGRKGQSYEGGHRVPFIVRWPGHIAPGRICNEPAMNIDLLPTCLAAAGLTSPSDRIIDGRDISKLLTSNNSKSPHEYLFFYHHGELEGIRAGKWKYFQTINHYVWPMPVNRARGDLSNHTTGPLPLLFNLDNDPGEAYNLIAKYPDIGKKLADMMISWEKKMLENPIGLIN